jgi:hypothetical protein
MNDRLQPALKEAFTGFVATVEKDIGESDTSDKDAQHRRDVYMEIIETERAYMRDLQTLVNLYLIPLSSLTGTEREILSKEEVHFLLSFLIIETCLLLIPLTLSSIYLFPDCHHFCQH